MTCSTTIILTKSGLTVTEGESLDNDDSLEALKAIVKTEGTTIEILRTLLSVIQAQEEAIRILGDRVETLEKKRRRFP